MSDDYDFYDIDYDRKEKVGEAAGSSLAAAEAASALLLFEAVA